MGNFRSFLSRRWFLAALGVAVLVGLAMFHPYPRQTLFGPTIRGKPWCVWEDAVRRNYNWDAHERSFWTKSLRWLGIKPDEMDPNDLFNHPEMVPLMVHLLDDADPLIRQRTLSNFYFHDKLGSPSVLPALQARLTDDDPGCRIEAAMAVVTVDSSKRTHHVLMEILDDMKSPHRFEAMRALTYVAYSSDDAFQAMIRYVKDPDAGVRGEIMFAVFRFGKRGVPTLMQGLDDTSTVVRKLALESLGTLGSDAATAIPAIQRRLDDPDLSVRETAATALAEIDPKRFGQVKPAKLPE